MEQIIAVSAIFLSATLIFTFPGVFICRKIGGLSSLGRLISTIYLSVSFWVVITWVISLCHLPLAITSASLMCLFALIYVVRSLRDFPSTFNLKFPSSSSFFALLALFVAVLLLSYPLLFITIPPGCDTSMHGYISRLIINNDGLPHSYQPILPVNYFGSYSAGYHILTALIAYMKVDYLRHAINFISVFSYPVSLLGIVFFLSRFFREPVAILTAIIYWGLNSSLQNTIGWGGTPTILAFGCSLFAGGLVLHAYQNKDRSALWIAALPVASILLIHAIPAVGFFYLAIPSLVLCWYYYSDRRKWLLTNTIIMGAIAIVLLLPFAVHFTNDNSPELILKIKNWQLSMMHNSFSTNVLKNIWATLGEMYFRIGDFPVIVSAVALVTLLIIKRYKTALIVTGFLLYLFLMILNYGYWYLPLSELLYPERIAFYLIVGVSFYFGYAVEYLWESKYAITFQHRKFNLHLLPVAVFLVISQCWIFNKANELRKNKINCNADTRNAFDWINRNTEKNALLVASYEDGGLWIPTFTNRATLGCHMHFIHEVTHIPDSMEAKTDPRYIFVTKRDIAEQTPILTRAANRKLVFENSEVRIYH